MCRHENRFYGIYRKEAKKWKESMRTEQEMVDLIINTAKADDRIRAIYMGGSRTNPNVKPDMFQNYDVVYIVEETRTFIKDIPWIRLFLQHRETCVKAAGGCGQDIRMIASCISPAENANIDRYERT